MASWLLHQQKVWISPRVVGFTVVCERCTAAGELFASVDGRLPLDARRGAIECRHGHTIDVERETR